MKKALFIALMIVLPFQAEAQERISGKVTLIVDGDTFHIGSRIIRVWGIDTPERGQAGYWAGGAALEKLIFRKTVDCETKDTDKYGRTVGQCFIDGKDVGAEMIRSGTAKEYTFFSHGFYSSYK